MVEVPIGVIVVAVLGILGSIITSIIVGLFARSASIRAAKALALVATRQQPIEESAAIIALTKQYVEVFRELIAVTKAKADQSAEQTHNAGLSQKTISDQAEVINRLITDVDSMPQAIADMKTEKGQDDAFIIEQDDALDKAGVPQNQRPIRKPAVIVTRLDPEELLFILEEKKRIRAAKETEANTPVTPA